MAGSPVGLKMRRGPFKSQALQLLRDRGVPVETILDVGVQQATGELMAAYPDKKHALFEPVAEFREAISHNYRDISHEIVQAAVSDSVGTVELMVAGSGADISHGWIANIYQQGQGRFVPMTTLDDYVASHDCTPPYFLKIDVDGHELAVLRGAAKTLSLSSVVMIEATAASLSERLSFLEQSGFRLLDLVECCYYDSALWQVDAIMIRRDTHAAKFADLYLGYDASKYETFG